MRRGRHFFAYAVAALVTLGLLSKEIRWWMHRDTRPCPTCNVLAYDRGKPFIDEQGHHLRFATPDFAARYSEDYRKAETRPPEAPQKP